MTDPIPAIEDCKFYHAMDLPQIGFVQAPGIYAAVSMIISAEWD